MNNMRETQRQPINVTRGCALGVITFKWLEWSDHVAQIVNISRDGVGIESAERLEPGFVWFKERVGGHRGGILIWSKQLGVTYRAGIKFVPLSPGEEHYVQEQVGHSDHGRSAPDPDAIIATLVESIKRSVN